MVEWFSAKELAGLPGMPGSDRGVEKRALKLGWLRQRRAGRGGGFEFHLSCLPSETQAHLKADTAARIVSESAAAKAGATEGAKLKLNATLAEEAARGRRLHALKKSVNLPLAAQQRIDAKVEILRALEQFHHASGLTLEKAEHLFAERYNSGAIVVSDITRGVVSNVGARTLRGWRNGVKKEGLTGLAGKYGNRRGSSKIDTQQHVRELIIGLLVAKPHARATHVMRALKARFSDSAVELPSMRSLERWIGDWRDANRQTLTAIANPDQWKNKYMTAFGSRSEGVVALNQLWEMDSTPADVMLTDGRHSILGVIDVYSRRARLFVTKTSKGTAIATLVRRALLDWGVPEEAKTDNGKDYTSQHVTRVFMSLDVKQTLCPPFQPWHKPHIERFFGTFTRDLVELLAGFIGHNIAERKAIEAQRSFADRLMKRDEVVDIRLSAAEFQSFCDRWCDDIYMHRAHDGLDQKTPLEMVSSWRAPIRRITDDRALDILLAAAPDRNGMRSVQKNGIAVEGAYFIAPELEQFVGEQVQVRFDPQDLGRIYVFGGPDLQFVCIAECPERTGINRQEVAIRAREQQKKRVQEERRALKAAARSVNTDDIVADILREGARASSKLAMFPKPQEQHDSAGLRAASDAVAAIDRPTRSTADLMPAEAFAAARARIEAETQKPVQPIFDKPFDRAYWLTTQSFARSLTEEEREYLARYRKENPSSARGLDELVNARFGAQHDPAAAG